MRLPLHLLFIFYCISSMAQTSDYRDEFRLPKGKTKAIRLQTDYFFSSDAITNEMANAYFNHAFITDEMKNEVKNYLGAENRFGAEWNSSLRYSFKRDSSGLTYHLSLQHHVHTDASFGTDVFELYFRGNKGFEGDTAFLNYTNVRSMTYHQIGFGISGTRKGQRLNWFAEGLLNICQEYFEVKTGEAYLYTASNGEYLDADLDLSIRQSDSAQSGLDAVCGWGLGLTAGFSYQLDETSFLHGAVRNLGFLSYDNQTSRVTADTTFRFEGIDATELFNFSDTIQGSIQNDTALVQSYLTDRQKKSHTFATPAVIDIWAERQFDNGKLNLAIGLRQFVAARALPIGWLDAGYAFHRNHTASLHLQYGGYTVWTAGIGYKFDSGSWQFQLSSDFISAWLRPEKGRSQGAFVSLSKYF